MTPSFRRLLWAAVKPNLVLLQPHMRFVPGKFSVAMHIRRGDVTATSGGSKRWVSVGFYEKLVLLLRRQLHQHADIHIISQGDKQIFSWFVQHSCTLHLDTPTDLAWAHMIQAQLFVMAPSAFSLTPAYYNKAIVVYEPHAFLSEKRLGHWITAADLPHLLDRISPARRAACRKGNG
jgi:hypothetical protein